MHPVLEKYRKIWGEMGNLTDKQGRTILYSSYRYHGQTGFFDAYDWLHSASVCRKILEVLKQYGIDPKLFVEKLNTQRSVTEPYASYGDETLVFAELSFLTLDHLMKAIAEIIS